MWKGKPNLFHREECRHCLIQMGFWDLLVLISSGKNKTSFTISEPKLKKALLSTVQHDWHWPGSYPGSPVWSGITLVRGFYKVKTYKTIYIPHSVIWEQGYILMCFLSLYILSICDQECPLQLGQQNLFTEAKPHSLLSCMKNSSQHSKKLPVFGQVGLIR